MSNEIEWLRGLLEKATPGPHLLATLRNIAPALVDVLEMTSHEHDVLDNWEACPSCATIERAVAAIRAEMEKAK